MAPTPTRRPQLLTVCRALGSLLVLALLVAGVPWLLLRAGTLPTSWPTPAAIGRAMTAPDDGHILFTVLTLLCWGLWMYFVLSLLLETVALLARVRVPKVRGLGSGQRLAGVLLGGVLMLPTANAIAATPAHAVTAPQLPHRTAAQEDRGPAPAASRADTATTDRASANGGPVHTVGATGETVWDLAEHYLGDGRRHTDIRALNPGLTQSFLTTGTRVQLPADARTPAPAPSGQPSTGTAFPGQASRTAVGADNPTSAPGTSSPAPHQQTHGAGQQKAEETAPYVVQPGDHLAKIAQETLGNADRWPELYEANRGEQQPYGHTFENANLIYPGQQIDLPTQGATPPAGSEAEQKPGAEKPTDRPKAPTSKPKPAERADPPPAPAASGGPAAGTERGQGVDGAARQPEASPTSAPAAPAPHGTAPAPPPSQEAGAPQTSRSSQPASTPPTDMPPPSADSESAGPLAGVVGLAASGAVAAALVGTLATRRLLQRRTLQRGRRIVMPQGRPAATEVLLRSVDASHELQTLDAMVRTLGVHLADEGRVLPALAAVRLGEQGALLYLEEPAEPVTPFTALDEAGLQWWCPIDSDQLLDDQDLREVDPPYPALVPLGDDTKGGIVLVDLEQVGVLHLVGAMRQQILRTLAIALALSPLGGQIELAVAGEDTAPGLTMLDPERVLAHDDLPGALRALTAHQAEQQQVLAGCAAGGLAAARLDGDVGELWPMVLLTDLDTCSGAEAAQEVEEVAGREPRTALAVLTSTGAAPAAGDVGWVVDTDAPGVTVPGTDVYCVLSACSDEEYADVIDLVLVSALGDEDDDDPALAGPTPQAATVTSPPAPDTPAPGKAPEDPAPTHLPPMPSGGSPLAALADLEDDVPADSSDSAPASGAVNATPVETEAEAGAEADRTAVEPAVASSPATAPAAEPAATPVAPVAATNPSQIVIPSLVPASRVNARIPSATAPAPPVPDEPALPEGPYVQVLGPVALDGAQGSITTNRRTAALEFIAWLALHPGAERHQIDELLAPGGRISRETRNSRTSDIRRWLGATTDGDPYLPHLNSQPDRLLRLDGVACDWHLFQQYADHGHQNPGPEGTRLLHQALSLVRGRPFAGVPPRRYPWAEALTQEMIKKIVHVAQDLAERSLHDRDGRSALWAATRGLAIAREAEVLWRLKFRALALLGQHIELEQAIRSLEAFLLELGCSMDEETVEILQQLQASHH